MMYDDLLAVGFPLTHLTPARGGAAANGSLDLKVAPCLFGLIVLLGYISNMCPPVGHHHLNQFRQNHIQVLTRCRVTCIQQIARHTLDLAF